MARSKRKTPIFGYTSATSEKLDKRRWNKTFRRVTKKLTRIGGEAPLKIEAVTNVWDGSKDGKYYYSRYTDKDLRK